MGTPLLAWGLSLLPIFKKWGGGVGGGGRDLARSQFLEGDYWERGGDLSSWGLQFLHKLKSEIFNDKKSL